MNIEWLFEIEKCCWVVEHGNGGNGGSGLKPNLSIPMKLIRKSVRKKNNSVVGFFLNMVFLKKMKKFLVFEVFFGDSSND